MKRDLTAWPFSERLASGLLWVVGGAGKRQKATRLPVVTPAAKREASAPSPGDATGPSGAAGRGGQATSAAQGTDGDSL